MLNPCPLSQAMEGQNGPDFMLASHEMIRPLSRLIKNITPLVNQRLLAQQWPYARTLFEYNDLIYGLPQRFEMTTLYYNRELVDRVPFDLDELAKLATPETQLAFHSIFYGASWGGGAFGGQLFDEEGQLLPELEGLVDWLTWLQDIQEQPGIILSPNQKN